MWRCRQNIRRLGRCYLLVFLSLLPAAPTMADERILEFASEIRIQRDARLTVAETITVRAEGDRIRRGIFRDFPTRYRDRMGNRFNINFEVLGVQRDGENEPWHTENRSNGVRVYMGRADRVLPPGHIPLHAPLRRDTPDRLF